MTTWIHFLMINLDWLCWEVIELVLKVAVLSICILIVARILQKPSTKLKYGVLYFGVVVAVFLPIISLCLPTLTIFPQQPSFDLMTESQSSQPYHESVVMDSNLQDRRLVGTGGLHQPSIFGILKIEFLLRTVILVAAAVWLVGVGWLSFRLLKSEIALAKLKRDSEQLESQQWQADLADGCHRLAIQYNISLVRSRELVMPMVCGIIRPTIVLPADCDNWTSQERKTVLLHELAHIANRDHWCDWIVRITQLLYWYDPLFNKVCTKLESTREMRCDELVSSCAQQPTEYAEGLLAIVSRYSEASCYAVGMGTRSQLEDRILAILAESPSATSRIARSLQFTVIAGLLASTTTIGLAQIHGKQFEIRQESDVSNQPIVATNEGANEEAPKTESLFSVKFSSTDELIVYFNQVAVACIQGKMVAEQSINCTESGLQVLNADGKNIDLEIQFNPLVRSTDRESSFLIVGPRFGYKTNANGKFLIELDASYTKDRPSPSNFKRGRLITGTANGKNYVVRF